MNSNKELNLNLIEKPQLFFNQIKTLLDEDIESEEYFAFALPDGEQDNQKQFNAKSAKEYSPCQTMLVASENEVYVTMFSYTLDSLKTHIKECVNEEFVLDGFVICDSKTVWIENSSGKVVRKLGNWDGSNNQVMTLLKNLSGDGSEIIGIYEEYK